MSSRRGYATTADAKDIDLCVTDEEISEAERLIDAYVGYQDKFLQRIQRLEVTAISGNTVFDTGSGNGLYVTDNTYTGCEIEIIGGTGKGQIRTIESSSREDRSITVSVEFDTALDTTSIARIYQLGKFPRFHDVTTDRAGLVYYKFIPESIKMATLYQLEYMKKMGASFFNSDETDFKSEDIGNYSYTKDESASLIKMIGPKVRAVLKGFKNSTGKLIA